MLRERIEADLQQAMRQNDEAVKNVLRLVKKGMIDAEVAGQTRRSLGDDEIQAIIRREIKQAQESIADFQRAGRPEEVAKLQTWVAILRRYLPEELTEQQIRDRLILIVEDLQANGQPATVATVMKSAMATLRGQADGRVVQRLVSELLRA